MSAFPEKTDLSEKIEKAITQNIAIEEKEVQLGTKIVQIFITPVLNVKTKAPYLEEPQKQEVLGASVLLQDITLEKNLAQVKDDFTNMVVHELRSPLTAMQGATNILVKEKTLSKDEQEKLLGIVNEQSKKLLDEVSSLLDAAKLEAGKFTIEKAQCDLGTILKDHIDMFLPQAQGKRIALLAHIDEHLPVIMADEKRIGQIINNVLSNSLKFTQNGGAITLSATSDESHITISVADSGIGIPKEKQAALFTRFAGRGTGLGLYIVKGIVEAHGGTVTLDSEASKGTTISFTLPIGIVEQTSPRSLPNGDGSLPPSQIFNTAIN